MVKFKHEKYVIVCFLKDNISGFFHSSEWPLHITIIRPFETLLGEKYLINLLKSIKNNFTPTISVGEKIEFFGDKNNIKVTEIKKTKELDLLNKDILKRLECDIKFVKPVYNKYRPHVTHQKSGNLKVGEVIEIKSISLVRIDNENRVILDKIYL